MNNKKTEEEEEDEEEEEEEEEPSDSTDEESVKDKKDEKEEAKVDADDRATEDREAQGSTEDGPVEEPTDPETVSKNQKAREKELHMFLVLTVHRILNKTGTLTCLNEVVTAAHIKRLVELTLDKFTLSEELTLSIEKHRLVAKSVTKELKKTFVGKVRCMLLLPDPSVEHVIAACIQKHTEKVMTEGPKTFWKRLCNSIF